MTDTPMHKEFARRWALLLTERESISGGDGEADFGPWLAEALRAESAFAGAEVWTLPVGPDDRRHCVAMLLRGQGPETVILTGHYDTVTTEDYGDLKHLATDPKKLLPALQARLARQASTAAEQRARKDFAGDAFLPGRGLLDMKAGLAAGLAACARFASEGSTRGNVLFLAVPDEEVNSVGARAAAPALAKIAADKSLEFVAAINLDSISDDDDDGRSGRIIALGTIGKVLPTAFVVGVAAHSGFPLAGINAGSLAGAIAARVEWAPSLTDDATGTPGTPPSLLSLRDGKGGYDVTTPSTAFLTFNVLSYTRSPDDVMDQFEGLCLEAADVFMDSLRERLARTRSHEKTTVLDRHVQIVRYAQVLEAAASHAENRKALEAKASELAATSLPLPEQCRQMTALAWDMAGWAGPAIVTGFGSIPYLPTTLSEKPAAKRLRAACAELAADAPERFGTALQLADYFAGISDMSFFGEADASAINVVAEHTPLWEAGVRWPAAGAIAGIPTVNFGPWGRDYHTPLERLHVGYAFGALPAMLSDLVGRILRSD